MKKEKSVNRKKIIVIFLISLGSLVVSWYLLLFFFSLIITPYTIKGHSMNTTLSENEIIATYSFNKGFKRGDILVIKKEGMKNCPEGEKDELLVKRVVAVSGDEIAFVIDSDVVYLYVKEGEIWNKIEEPYIGQPMVIESFSDYPYLYNSLEEINEGLIIEEHQVYIMGDNRNDSFDSRMYGTFNVDYVCNVFWFNISRTPFFNFIYKFFL